MFFINRTMLRDVISDIDVLEQNLKDEVREYSNGCMTKGQALALLRNKTHRIGGVLFLKRVC
jgi:hypothetical protein